MTTLQKGIGILFIFICIPFVSANTITIFENYIAEGRSAEIDGKLYTAYEFLDYDKYHKYNESVRLFSNTYGSLILVKGQPLVKEPYTFTFSHALEADETMFYHITVIKDIPTIDFERTIDTKNPKLKDSILITITIKNKGDDTLTAVYQENLPTEVVLLENPEIIFHNSTLTQKAVFADVYWNGALEEGEVVQIRYRIKIKQYPSLGNNINFSNASLTYQDTSGSYEYALEPLIIILPLPLEIFFTPLDEKGKSIMTIGKELPLLLTLQNNYKETLLMEDFVFFFPEGIEVQEFDRALEENVTGYHWSGSIQPLKNRTFSFVFVPRKWGTLELATEAHYSYKGSKKGQNIFANGTLLIETKNVTPEIRIHGSILEGGKTIRVVYAVNNTDPYAYYKDEDLLLSSELFDPLRYKISLPPKTRKIIVNQELLLPYTDTVRIFSIIMNGTYDGANYTIVKNITVQPVSVTSPFELSISGQEKNDTHMTIEFLLMRMNENVSQPSLLEIRPSIGSQEKTFSFRSSEIEELFTTEQLSFSWDVSKNIYKRAWYTINSEIHYRIGNVSYYTTTEQILPLSYNNTNDSPMGTGAAIALDQEPALEKNETSEVGSSHVSEAREENTNIERENLKNETKQSFWRFLPFVISTALLSSFLLFFWRFRKRESL